MNIVWAPLALERICEQSDWLCRANPATAQRWIADMFNAVERLTDLPLSGPQVQELNRFDLHCGKYLSAPSESSTAWTRRR